MSALLSDIFPKDMYNHRSAQMDRVSWAVNMFLSLPLSNIIFSFIGIIIIGVIFSGMLDSVFGAKPMLLHATWAIVLLQFLGAHFGFSFAEYVTHYAMHRVPILWAIHRPHHSAERLNYFTVGRAYPLEYIVLGGGRVIGTAVGTGLVFHLTGTELLPATVQVQTVVTIVYSALVGAFQHLHIPISFGTVFNIIIGGPVLHQIHHSAELHHRDKNIGDSQARSSTGFLVRSTCRKRMRYIAGV